MMEEDVNAAAGDEENQKNHVVLPARQAELNAPPQHGVSNPGRQANENYRRVMDHVLIYNDYFSVNPTHGPIPFQQCFRTQKDVFMRIVYDVREYDDYFELKQDHNRLIGFSSNQKCDAAMQYLAHGAAAYTVEMTTFVCLSRHALNPCTCFMQRW